MMADIARWGLNMATWIVERFPDADVGPLTEFVEPISRLICWMLLLNEVFPIAEGMIGMTLMGGVWFALYGVMTIRRIFSLFWPGAGS